MIDKELFFKDFERQKRLFDKLAMMSLDCYNPKHNYSNTVRNQLIAVLSQIESNLIRQPAPVRDISSAGIYSDLLTDAERIHGNKSFVLKLAFNSQYSSFVNMKNSDVENRSMQDTLFLDTEIASRRSSTEGITGFTGSYFFITEKDGKPCWATPLKMYCRFHAIRSRVLSPKNKLIMENLRKTVQLAVDLRAINTTMSKVASYSPFSKDRAIVAWIDNQISLLANKTHEISSIVQSANILGVEEKSPLVFFEQQLQIASSAYPAFGRALIAVLERNRDVSFGSTDHATFDKLVRAHLSTQGLTDIEIHELMEIDLPSMTRKMAERFFHSKLRSHEEVCKYNATVEIMKKYFPEGMTKDAWLYDKIRSQVVDDRDFFNVWTAAK